LDSLKLWNVASQETDPLSILSTKQTTHKDLVYSEHTNLFAVAAASTELKLFKLGAPAKASGLELVLTKALTLVNHNNEVMCVAMHGSLVVSIAADHELIVNRINKDLEQSSLVFSMKLD
jgi:hypothetical protein